MCWLPQHLLVFADSYLQNLEDNIGHSGLSENPAKLSSNNYHRIFFIAIGCVSQGNKFSSFFSPVIMFIS